LFAMYGGLKSKEYVEQDNWYWHYIGRQDFGGVLSRPERTRRHERGTGCGWDRLRLRAARGQKEQ